MENQTKSVSEQGASLVPAQPASDAATLQMLVQLLLAERQEALQEREERKRALKAKNEQRQLNAQYSVAEKNKIQAMCTHKKGGKGLKGSKIDYAVYFHTFTDQSSYIRCQICGMKWRNVDTPETLIRKGVKIPNHTGIGWREAYRMLSESTNTASSSEVQMTAQAVGTDVSKLE